MSISEDISNYLTSYATLKAVIDDRLFPIIEKANAKKPFIAFTKVDQDDERVMGGIANNAALYEFELVAETHTDLESTIFLLKTALRAMTGTVGSSTVRDVECREAGQGYIQATREWRGTVEATVKYAP